MTQTNKTAEAQAALDAALAALDAHQQVEQEMGARMQALDAEETKLKVQVASAQSALIDALAAGNTDAAVVDVTAAQTKIQAIVEARKRFPAQLQAHRERGALLTGKLIVARAALGTAQFDDAVYAYRAAMESVWPLAEAVWQLGGGGPDMAGMADPGSRFGRLRA